MEFKLFGKELFSISRDNGGPTLFNAELALKKAEYLPDFYTNSSNSQSFGDIISLSDWTTTNTPTGIVGVQNPKQVVKKKVEKERVKVTPKKLFQLKALNTKGFELKADPAYLDEQIDTFKNKLALYKDKSSDYRGSNEIQSILIRLENRKKYAKNRKFYEDFAYTTTERVDRLVKQHSHLRLGEVSQFLADMPKEAIDVMKKYTDETKRLCEKKPIFYIIANKKDFEKTEKRRDPILLVQSPFAHVWQILGAWDEEMILVNEL